MGMRPETSRYLTPLQNTPMHPTAQKKLVTNCASKDPCLTFAKRTTSGQGECRLQRADRSDLTLSSYVAITRQDRDMSQSRNIVVCPRTLDTPAHSRNQSISTSSNFLPKSGPKQLAECLLSLSPSDKRRSGLCLRGPARQGMACGAFFRILGESTQMSALYRCSCSCHCNSLSRWSAAHESGRRARCPC